MNRLLLLIILGVTLFLCNCRAEIIVKIAVDKYEYLEAEPIFITVDFFNSSNTIDSINYFAIEEAPHSIKVGGSDNREFFRGGLTSDFLFRVPYTLINPNEHLFRKFNLLEYCIDVKLRLRLHGSAGFLSCDKYKINYSFENGLKSNEIVFAINKPGGTDSAVFEKLLNAYQINDGNPWTLDSILLKRDLYYGIAEINENSVYWEEAVFRYNEESNWLKIDSIDMDVNKKFIDKLPNSYFLPLVFEKLCKAIHLYGGGEQEVENYIDYLMFKHQNTNIYELALQEKTRKTYLK